MSEEDSDSTFTDSQAEESELPVIQLCGLVEELRYSHRWPLWPQLPAETHLITVEKELVFSWLALLLACSWTDELLMEHGQGGGARGLVALQRSDRI